MADDLSTPFLEDWATERRSTGLLAWCRRDWFLKGVEASQVGILALSVVLATYLLTQGKAFSVCSPANDAFRPTIIQTLIATISFDMIAPTIVLGSVLKNALGACRPLSFVSTITLTQLALAVTLSAWMAYCIAEASLTYIIMVTGTLLCLIVLMWAFSFNRTERLVTFIRLRCLAHADGA